MTTPTERTKAVVGARDFLQMLSTAEEVTIRGLVQSVATGLLRHYPLNVDLDVSASALPGIWTHPYAEPDDEKEECADVIPLFRTRTEE